MNPTIGRGQAVGTCGELVQGHYGGRELMVTFPVDWHTDATARGSYVPGIRVWPRSKTKVRKLCELLLARTESFDPDTGLDIMVNSSIPEGRGYASSSADLVAAARAISQWTGSAITDDEILRLCCGIEPSDAVCYTTPTLFDFLSGEVLYRYTNPPALTALVIDEGGQVNTLARHRTGGRLPYTHDEREMLAEAFTLADNGFAAGDPVALGQAATISAHVNQARLPKRAFAAACAVAEMTGAYGVSAAHSGTTLALLFDPHNAAGIRAAAQTLNKAASQCDIFLLNTPKAEHVTEDAAVLVA